MKLLDSYSRRSALWFALILLAAQWPVLAQQPASRFGQLMAENSRALMNYSWKMRTEIVLDGETRNISLQLLRFDHEGKLQKTPIGGTPPKEPGRGIRGRIAAKKQKEMQELVQELIQTANLYAYPKPALLQGFLQRATIWEGRGATAGMLRIEGRQFASPKDSVKIWLDAESKRPRKLEAQAIHNDEPLQITADYKDLPNGPTHVARTVISYPEEKLRIAIENFEYTLLKSSASQSPAQSKEADSSAERIPRWPKKILADEAEIVIHQPQVDDWTDYLRLEGRVAVAVTLKGEQVPLIGAVRFKADTRTDFDTRTVLIFNKEITEARFPSLDKETSERMERLLKREATKDSETVLLDAVLLNMDQTKAAASKVNVRAEPPAVFYSRKSAILVLFDGEPVLAPIQGTDLMFAINTNWDIFFHKGASSYYLLNEDQWLMASDIKGVWRTIDRLPDGFSKIPDEENWQEARKHISARGSNREAAPTVFVSTSPAELIVTEGDPAFTPISGTKLMFVSNTESDLFFHTGDKSFYYLVSGRWFRAKALTGSWSGATADLPADFAEIPSTHPRGYVLASVPGTPEATEAIFQTQIPRQASVNRKEAAVEVSYNGEPVFEPVEGTSMSYAVNTAFDVIRAGDLYYVCFQGVWFMSATPSGPWTICDSVPDQIYTIPPSSPVHHTTYVYVYDSTPDVVVYGYTGGYVGVYFYNGVIVYGTGYYYRPYIYYGRVYPIYYPRHYTYGVAAYYNPYTGTYARGAARYGPYGGYGRAAAYNPRTGTYARGAAVWGPRGGVWAAEAYNPRTGIYAATYQAANPYAQWGESVVRRGDNWVHTSHYTNDRGTRGRVETSGGARGAGYRGDEHSVGVARSGDGDLYVGKDGNVFKRADDGWYRYDEGNWNQVEREADARPRERIAGSAGREKINRSGENGRKSLDQLDRDFKARTEGRQRNQDFQSWRNSGRSLRDHQAGRAGTGGGRRGRTRRP